MNIQIIRSYRAGLLLACAGALILLYSFKNLHRNSAADYAPTDCTLSFIIDGGKYHHQLISVKGNPAFVMNGAYSGSYTKVVLSDRPAPQAKETVEFELSVEGTKPTTQHIGDKINSELDQTVHLMLHITEQGQLRYFMADYNDPAKVTPGTITISKYGAVGDNIEGTFAGKLTSEVNEKEITLTITDGHFSVEHKS